jgi:hypothetical protein
MPKGKGTYGSQVGRPSKNKEYLGGGRIGGDTDFQPDPGIGQGQEGLDYTREKAEGGKIAGDTMSPHPNLGGWHPTATWEFEHGGEIPTSDARMRSETSGMDAYQEGGKVEGEKEKPITEVKTIEVPVHAKTDLSRAIPKIDTAVDTGLTKAKEIAEDVKKKGKQVVAEVKEKRKVRKEKRAEEREARKKERRERKGKRLEERLKRKYKRKASRKQKVDKVKQTLKSKFDAAKKELEDYSKKHSPRKTDSPKTDAPKTDAPKTDAPKKKVMGEVSPGKKKKAKPKFFGREYDTE